MCDKHDPEYYPKFKKWCAMNTLLIPFPRRVARGTGGVFFDNLNDKPWEEDITGEQHCHILFCCGIDAGLPSTPSENGRNTRAEVPYHTSILLIQLLCAAYCFSAFISDMLDIVGVLLDPYP